MQASKQLGVPIIRMIDFAVYIERHELLETPAF